MKSNHTEHGGCKWGLYGDTVLMPPVVLQGTVRQRHVGSRPHSSIEKSAFLCNARLKRWKQYARLRTQLAKRHIRNRDNSVQHIYINILSDSSIETTQLKSPISAEFWSHDRPVKPTKRWILRPLLHWIILQKHIKHLTQIYRDSFPYYINIHIYIYTDSICKY